MLEEKVINKGKLKFIIVDDDEISQFYLIKALNRYFKDITIICANNGEDAVNIYHNNKDVDVILMDIRMPKMSGIEATKLIRKNNKDVIIIAQTASLGNKEEYLNAGCNSYILKPIHHEELYKLINKYI